MIENYICNVFGQLGGIGRVVVAQTDDGEPLLGESQQLALEADKRATMADGSQPAMLADHQTKSISQAVAVVELALSQ
jgi:hypothetical protein